MAKVYVRYSSFIVADNKLGTTNNQPTINNSVCQLLLMCES